MPAKYSFLSIRAKKCVLIFICFKRNLTLNRNFTGDILSRKRACLPGFTVRIQIEQMFHYLSQMDITPRECLHLCYS